VSSTIKTTISVRVDTDDGNSMVYDIPKDNLDAFLKGEVAKQLPLPFETSFDAGKWDCKIEQTMNYSSSRGVSNTGTRDIQFKKES
jgi:hypothetical protein